MLSKRQFEIINGSLLADGTIWTNFIENSLCKFNLTQSKCDHVGIDKKRYLAWYISEFIDIGCSVRLQFKRAKGLVNGTFESYVFNTKCHPLWNKLEQKWYVPIEHNFWKRKKVIPSDLILTPLTLCIWHMEDGTNYAKNANINLCTNGFTLNECEFLINRLKIDLNIESHIIKKKSKYKGETKTYPVIYIGRKSYFDFIDMIKPHVEWDCFQYKLDTTTYNKKTQIGEDHSQSKLSNEQIKQIFELREEGKLHREIASIFNVSQSAITQILNGKRRSHSNLANRITEKPRLTIEQKQQVKKLFEDGLSQLNIANQLRISQASVSRICGGVKCQESI